MTPWGWLRGLVGNATKATVLIGIFILLLIVWLWRCTPTG